MRVDSGWPCLAIVVVFVAVLHTSCSTEVETPPLPTERVDVDLTVAAVTGCYATGDLRALAPAGVDPRFYLPPALFFLSTETLSDTVTGYRRIETPPNTDSPLRLTAWSLRNAKELEANWTTGFAGVRLVLRRQSTDRTLYGRLESISDGSGTQGLGNVVVKPVECWPGA